MKIKITLLLFTILLAFACNKQNKMILDTIFIKKKALLLPDNKDTVPYININIDFDFVHPKSFNNKDKLQKLQQLFQKQFLGENYQKCNSPQEAINIFIDSCVTKYREIYAKSFEEQADSTLYYMYQHSISIYNKVVFTNNNLISFYVTNSSYQGGAHGLYSKILVSIDLKNIKEITFKDVFKKDSKEELTKIIQAKLIKIIKDKGGNKSYFFEFDEIEPNENFYVTDKGVQFTYNQYEIAAYSSGLFDVFIPYNEIKQILKSNFMEEYNILN